MRHRPLIVRAFVGMALAIVWSTAAAAQEAPRMGSWIGVGLQSTVLSDTETWTMQVAFVGDEVRVDYPSLGCRATWTRNDAGYRETITAGDCIDHGLVTLHEQEGKLFVNWTVQEEGPDVAATAVLFPSVPIA